MVGKAARGETPEQKLDRRRRVVAYLRVMADRSEALAAEYRREADRLDPDEPPRPATPPRDDDYTPEAIDRTVAEDDQGLELLAALAPGLAAAGDDPETSPEDRAGIRRIAARLRELELGE